MPIIVEEEFLLIIIPRIADRHLDPQTSNLVHFYESIRSFTSSLLCPNRNSIVIEAVQVENYGDRYVLKKWLLQLLTADLIMHAIKQTTDLPRFLFLYFPVSYVPETHEPFLGGDQVEVHAILP